MPTSCVLVCRAQCIPGSIAFPIAAKPGSSEVPPYNHHSLVELGTAHNAELGLMLPSSTEVFKCQVDDFMMNLMIFLYGFKPFRQTWISLSPG